VDTGVTGPVRVCVETRSILKSGYARPAFRQGLIVFRVQS
jgi:hypothetical protein